MLANHYLYTMNKQETIEKLESELFEPNYITVRKALSSMIDLLDDDVYKKNYELLNDKLNHMSNVNSENPDKTDKITMTDVSNFILKLLKGI